LPLIKARFPRKSGAMLTSAQDTNTLKKLDKLSDQLDAAKDASEAATKEVQHARQTTEKVKHDVRQHQRLDDTKRKRKSSQHRNTEDGKSMAAVELGRKGGAARAKTLTKRQRSAVAKKAATTRWNRH
jgi:hypothetical protein